MFSWNFAKSAEAMFSRWAIKKVFKFLLKKKLGQFILGDIDLNQLDVQLRAGTIQLSDLALNVDYINQKFGAVAALTVKEGSIGSLSVTMPWKSNGCQIELDELELVLGPRGKKISEDEPAKSQYGEYDIGDDFRTSESDPLDNTVTTASVDVHEGVKTIAKMVKWLLTSFHVRINKLIVAFDPYTEDAKNNGFCRTLVMRIAEMECGTGTSEENNSDDHMKSDNFLGLNRLTNFVKFHGAILEFLQIDDDCDEQSAVPCASATTSSKLVKVCCPPNVTTSIITGESGGFSGSVKLSIPWKNGSLDIRKVDADVNIDPLELRFQPSSIKCLLHLFEVYRDLGESGKGQMDFMDIESVYHNAASSLSSPVGSYTYSTERSLSNCGTSSEICSPVGKETVSDTLLPGSHLISDWVSSTSRKQRESTSVEPDFGASVEQFFECFDELRTSQSALGNSGMWNWTCSVFSAITAASNLASGSLHTPTEHKHIETNLKANISGISLLFSFVDEDPKTNGRPSVHYLGAKFQSTLFMLQVCASEMNIKATVEQFELADHFSSDNDVVDGNLRGYYDDIESQVTLIRKMQSAVEVSLPLSSPGKYHSFAQATKSVYPINRQIKASHDGSLYRSDVVKVTLFRTSGFIECLCTVNFGSSIHNVSRATSFSLKLPPFVLWVNFHLMTMILDILKEPRDLVETTITCHRSLDEACDAEFMSSSLVKAGKISCPQVKSSSSNGRLKGNVFLANARIILCFPYEKSGDFRNYTSWDQFIALDISTCSTLREEKVQASRRTPVVRSKKGHSLASCSLHLNVGNLGIYLLTASSTASGESESSMQNLKYLSQKIVSVTGQTGRPSVLSMFWQDDHLTGPWMAEKAKLLATSVDSSRMEKCVGKGHDFTSVTTVKDVEDTDTRTREEIIWSSSFILHAHVASLTVNFDSSQYKTLNDLIHQVTDWVSCLTSNPVDGTVQSFSPQTSVLMECDFVEFRVKLELEENIKGSIQNELPGCWRSFKLQTRKVELLSVLNIGGINDSIFSWMAHGMGSLWGSVTLFPTNEFLLISCHNSTMGRGDGDGSNVLSSRMSGSDIVHFWDPVNSYSHTSLTIRCATLFALGGRLDWLDSVSSFFSLSSSETEQAGYDHLQEEDCWRNGPVGSSFVVNLIDIGLSYEPYLGDFVGAANANEEYFGCLLAASSFKISNTMLSDSINREYKITVQELGLLLCPVSGLENIGNSYSVEHLRKYGYVKVAQEAHVEAILRMNSVNGHLWELECTESHIVLNTCHDTTSGLIRLSAQLQQLFAPDIEESIVHLQNQWDSTQQVHVDDEVGIYSGDHSFSISQVTASHEDKRSGPGVAPHLMDEICENAFQLNQYGNLDSEFTEIKPCTSINAGHLGETHTLGSKDPPELIEEYFLSDVYSFSEPSSKQQPSIEALKCKPNNFKDQELQRGRSGWYGDASLRILENHVSEISKQTGLQKPEELECFNHVKHDKYKKVKGKVILKNINFTWRLCAGSDWQNFHKTEQLCVNFPGRDSTACMELSLSGIEVNYLVFPDGDICMSRLSLSVLDLRVNDNSKDAPWKLVLGYYHSKDHPRVSTSKALKLDLEAVRPHPSTPLEEYRLCVGLLPVVLHLHQRQLDFLIKFFGEKDSLTSCAQQPRILPKQGLRAGDHNINEEALLPYFQKFDILPFTIRVDYSPCHVDLAALRGGKYVELVNLVPWKGVELQLRHVEGVGVYGWSCIIETIVGEWLEDISQNQVHKLLKGLPPIRSLVAVGSGAAKLVSLPVKNYKKDHRLLKGMQRGTIAFLRSISVEAIGLGVHLAAGAHEILLQAENILTTIPPSVPWPSESRINNNVRSNQPKDARQGIKQAYESISDGLGKSAAALVQSPLKRYQRGGGVGSVLATAVQSAPAAAIAPASAAARAVHCALLGVRNSLDLERKKESMDKYLGSAQPL